MHPNRIQLLSEDSTKPLDYGKVLPLAQGDFTIAHGGGAADPGNAVLALHLLFAVGECPDRRTVLEAIEAADGLAVSIDAAQISSDSDEAVESPPSAGAGKDALLEIVCGGLAFEIQGVAVQDAEGPAYGRGTSMSPPSTEDVFDALSIVSGPHLASGATTMPVLRGQSRTAELLGRELGGLKAYSWSEAGNLVEPARYATLAADWHQGGAFPVEVFVRFKSDIDGGLATKGLEVFTGQELRLEPEIVEAMPDARRLAVRIAAQLVPTGTLSEAQDFTTPDGRNLRLEPSRNGRYVRAFLR